MSIHIWKSPRSPGSDTESSPAGDRWSKVVRSVVWTHSTVRPSDYEEGKDTDGDVEWSMDRTSIRSPNREVRGRGGGGWVCVNTKDRWTFCRDLYCPSPFLMGMVRDEVLWYPTRQIRDRKSVNTFPGTVPVSHCRHRPTSLSLRLTLVPHPFTRCLLSKVPPSSSTMVRVPGVLKR